MIGHFKISKSATTLGSSSAGSVAVSAQSKALTQEDSDKSMKIGMPSDFNVDLQSAHCLVGHLRPVRH